MNKMSRLSANKSVIHYVLRGSRWLIWAFVFVATSLLAWLYIVPVITTMLSDSLSMSSESKFVSTQSDPGSLANDGNQFPSSPNNENTLPTIIAVLTVFAGILLFVLQQFAAQILALTQSVGGVHREVAKQVEEGIDKQSKSTIQRTERLLGALQSVEDDFPWLSRSQQLPHATNVPTTAAVLKTLYWLVQEDQDNVAHEWLANAISDNNLSGDAFQFSVLAFISKMVFSDHSVSDRYKTAAYRSGWHSDPSTLACNMLSAISKNNTSEAVKIAIAIERLYLPGVWGHFASGFWAKSDRLKPRVSHDQLASLLLYVEMSGDTVCRDRNLPMLQERAGEHIWSQAEQLAAQIRAVLTLVKNPSCSVPSVYNSWISASPLTLLKCLEIAITRYGGTGQSRAAATMTRSILDALLYTTGDFSAIQMLNLAWDKLCVPESGSERTVEQENMCWEPGEFARDVDQHQESEVNTGPAANHGTRDVSDPVWDGAWRPSEPSAADIKANRRPRHGWSPDSQSEEDSTNRGLTQRTLEKQVQDSKKQKAASSTLESYEQQWDQQSTKSESETKETIDDVPSPSWKRIQIDKVLRMGMPEVLPGRDRLSIVEGQTSCWIKAAPWYPEGHILRFRDESWKPSNLRPHCVIYRNGENIKFERLSGGSAEIHKINSITKMKLTKDVVHGYAKMFCDFVYGDKGPFHILETVNTPFMPNEMPDDLRMKIATVAGPMTSSADGDGFVLKSTVYYDTVIFACVFKVDEEGAIEMQSDEPLLSGVPATTPMLLLAEREG